MAKYLNETGLTYFWDKAKSYIDEGDKIKQLDYTSFSIIDILGQMRKDNLPFGVYVTNGYCYSITYNTSNMFSVIDNVNGVNTGIYYAYWDTSTGTAKGWRYYDIESRKPILWSGNAENVEVNMTLDNLRRYKSITVRASGSSYKPYAETKDYNISQEQLTYMESNYGISYATNICAYGSSFDKIKGYFRVGLDQTTNKLRFNFTNDGTYSPQFYRYDSTAGTLLLDTSTTSNRIFIFEIIGEYKDDFKN